MSNIIKPRRPIDAQPQATAAELDEPWQTVSVKNTHPSQVHIVRDRAGQYVRIGAGQTVLMPLSLHDINYFRAESLPRYFADGTLKPTHPVKILDAISAPEMSEDQKQALQAARK